MGVGTILTGRHPQISYHARYGHWVRHEGPVLRTCSAAKPRLMSVINGTFGRPVHILGIAVFRKARPGMNGITVGEGTTIADRPRTGPYQRIYAHASFGSTPRGCRRPKRKFR